MSKSTAKILKQGFAAMLGMCVMTSYTVPANAAALPSNLNLASTHKTVIAPTNISPTLVNVGGHAQLISPGQAITPAESAALTQILNGGAQTLNIGIRGNAVGGSLVLDPGSVLNSIAIPSHVNVLRNFAGSAMNLTGDLTNSGNFYAVSTNLATSTAAISALDLTNNRGALLTSIMPTGALASAFSGLNPNLSLSLTVANKFTNHGTISSAGDLTITGGQNLLVQNANGSLSANNITIQTTNSGSNNWLSVIGGNLLSNVLNLNAGVGTLTAAVSNITGLVNVTGTNAHVGAHGANLNLGDLNVTGDPTFWNTGTITITGSPADFGESIAILAGQDIKFDTTSN
ncbi:MAG TPA: hypothetical protein V6D22_04335, partial [Candidatus Obscuribacterales bacterium]